MRQDYVIFYDSSIVGGLQVFPRTTPFSFTSTIDVYRIDCHYCWLLAYELNLVHAPVADKYTTHVSIGELVVFPFLDLTLLTVGKCRETYLPVFVQFKGAR